MRETILVEGLATEPKHVPAVPSLATVLVEASFVVFAGVAGAGAFKVAVPAAGENKKITKAMKNKLKISSPIFRSSSMGCSPVVGLCAQPLGVRREK
jgi:hypothetical protein